MSRHVRLLSQRAIAQRSSQRPQGQRRQLSSETTSTHAPTFDVHAFIRNQDDAFLGQAHHDIDRLNDSNAKFVADYAKIALPKSLVPGIPAYPVDDTNLQKLSAWADHVKTKSATLKEHIRDLECVDQPLPTDRPLGRLAVAVEGLSQDAKMAQLEHAKNLEAALRTRLEASLQAMEKVVFSGKKSAGSAAAVIDRLPLVDESFEQLEERKQKLVQAQELAIAREREEVEGYREFRTKAPATDPLVQTENDEATPAPSTFASSSEDDDLGTEELLLINSSSPFDVPSSKQPERPASTDSVSDLQSDGWGATATARIQVSSNSKRLAPPFSRTSHRERRILKNMAGRAENQPDPPVRIAESTRSSSQPTSGDPQKAPTPTSPSAGDSNSANNSAVIAELRAQMARMQEMFNDLTNQPGHSASARAASDVVPPHSAPPAAPEPETDKAAAKRRRRMRIRHRKQALLEQLLQSVTQSENAATVAGDSSVQRNFDSAITPLSVLGGSLKTGDGGAKSSAGGKEEKS